MRSRHDGVALRHIHYLCGGGIRAEHHGLIEVAVVWLEHVFCYVIGNTVYIVRLVAHEDIHRSVFPRLQVAHNSVECDRSFLFCHNNIYNKV